MVKVGDIIGAVNTAWMDHAPFPHPFVVIAITDLVITAEALVGPDRNGPLRYSHFKRDNVVAVFPDEATARTRIQKACLESNRWCLEIGSMSVKRDQSVAAILRGEA